MITRKPRKGEKIEHIANFTDVVNKNDSPVWEYAGVISSVEGNIAYLSGGVSSCFIWRFTDSMNKAHRIA